MLLTDARKSYRRLTQEQKGFIHKGTSSAMSIPKWIKFLEPLCQFDELSDQARDATSWLVLVSGIAILITAFVSIVAVSPWPFLASIIVFIAIMILRRPLHKNDINNNIRNVVFPLLHALALEVGHKKKVKLHLNFSKPLKREDIASVDDRSTLFNKQKAEFYEYQVLELDCEFLDGTRLTWKVNDIVRRRTRTNARGKTKTKQKLKRRILIGLSFKKSLYQLSQHLPKPGNHSGKFTQDDHKITYKRTIKQVANGSTAEIDLGQLLRATYQPYSFLAPGDQAI